MLKCQAPVRHAQHLLHRSCTQSLCHDKCCLPKREFYFFFSQRVAQKERSHQIKDNAYLSLTPLAFPDRRSKGRSREKEKKSFPKRAMRDSPSPRWLSQQPVTQRGAVCAACLEAHRLRDGKSASAGVKFFIDISSFRAALQIASVQEGFQTERSKLTFSPTCAGSLERKQNHLQSV